MHRSTTIPIASGEHFYGRWEVERYLQAGGLSVVQADPEWCGGTSELLRIGTVASLHDVPVIPHGHSLRAAIHTIASQSPMTFPLGEYLINKMRHYYHFEATRWSQTRRTSHCLPAPASTSNSIPQRSNRKPHSKRVETIAARHRAFFTEPTG